MTRLGEQAVRGDVISDLQYVGVLPVVVIDDGSLSVALADALVDGGIPCLEITLRTPAAEAAIRAISDRSDVLVGAGTVLDPEGVNRAADAGARFIVSPGFDPMVVERTLELGLMPIPGIATASEIQSALRSGVTSVKLFPATALGGVPTIRSLAAPFAAVRFVPSGGITVETMLDYLAEPSVAAVGGSWMVPRDRIAARGFTEIRELASSTSRRIADAQRLAGTPTQDPAR